MQQTMNMTEKTQQRVSPSRLFAALLLWTLLLHLLLIILGQTAAEQAVAWQQGFLQLLDAQAIVSAAKLLMFSLFAILCGSVALRVREHRPNVYLGLALGRKMTLARALRLLGLYAGWVLLGGLVEFGLHFHFAASIGIYCFMMTLVLGMLWGGERAPFQGLHLRPEPLAGRFAFNLLSLVLASALYTSFIYYYEIHRWEYGLDIPAWMLFQSALTVACVILAWALLHGSLRDLVARVLKRIEDDARGHRVKPSGVWREVSAHGAVAAVVLVLLHLAEPFANWFRVRDAWLVTETNRVVLGVDWYFLEVKDWQSTGQLSVLLGFLTVAGIVASLSAVDAVE